METRKVTIINSRSQSQKVIQDSKATTLGELKAEMRERGIDYSGMTFYEGHMRAELKDDADYTRALLKIVEEKEKREALNKKYPDMLPEEKDRLSQ